MARNKMIRSRKRLRKRRKKDKEFGEMSKRERKEFLSNDVIERMIRVEQRVSASFGEPVPYNETHYYKGLSKKEKENFEKYLRKRKRRRFLIPAVLLISLIVFLLSGTEFTGRVIEESTGLEEFSLRLFSVLFFLIAVFLSILFLILRKRKEKRFERNFEVIDEILFK